MIDQKRSKGMGGIVLNALPLPSMNFVAGITFRAAIRHDPADLNLLTEEVGSVLNGITFVLFGAILLGPALGELSWQLALYAVLNLTVVRIIPVARGCWERTLECQRSLLSAGSVPAA
jgi:NhaP-type Na+/H+ or K+/H+ antiporter